METSQLQTIVRVLTIRQSNLYRSCETYPDDPRQEGWMSEISEIDDALAGIKQLRDKKLAS